MLPPRIALPCRCLSQHIKSLGVYCPIGLESCVSLGLLGVSLASHIKRTQTRPPPPELHGAGLRRQRIGCLRIGFGFTCGAGRGPTGTGHGHWTGDLRQWKNPAFCSHLAGEHVWEPLMTLPVNRPCPSGGSHSLEQRSPPCGGQLEISTGETIARSETILTSPTCNWWAPFGAFWGELRQKKGFVSEAVHN